MNRLETTLCGSVAGRDNDFSRFRHFQAKSGAHTAFCSGGIMGLFKTVTCLAHTSEQANPSSLRIGRIIHFISTNSTFIEFTGTFRLLEFYMKIIAANKSSKFNYLVQKIKYVSVTSYRIMSLYGFELLRRGQFETSG